MTSFTELYYTTTAYLKKYSQLILAILFVILGLANCFLPTDLSRNTGIVQVLVGIASGILFFFKKWDQG